MADPESPRFPDRECTHNSDGIVVDSSSDVLIEYAHLTTSDDTVVIKSGMNEDGQLIDIPAERVVVRNFIVRCGIPTRY